MRLNSIAPVAALAATAAGASIPPAYQPGLPPEHHQGDVAYITGGLTREEADSIKRAAQQFPLELVFVEKDGGKPRRLHDVPVTITDARDRVVFDGPSRGPYFIARLPKGRYTVTTQWDDWTFSRPVAIGSGRQRVVFEWRKSAPPRVG